MVSRPARVGVVWGLLVALAVLAVALRRRAPVDPLWADLGFLLLVPLAVASVGALVRARRPEHPVGPLFLASAAAMIVGDGATAYAAAASHTDGLTAPAAWLGATAASAGTNLLVLPMLLIPDGRLPSRRWRPVFAAGVGFIALRAASTALAPGQLPNTGLDNPLGVPVLAPLTPTVGTVEPVVMFGLVFAAAASLLIRHRHGDLEQRRRLAWVAASALVFIAVLAAHPVIWALGLPMPGGLSDGLFLLAVVTFPVCLGIAILRHRLMDIEAVLGTALVYGALTALLTALYVVVVTYFGTVLGNAAGRLGGLVATAGVAVAFAPLRERLHRAVDRLLHGDRRDPYTALTRLGERLGQAAGTEADLQPMVAAVAAGLRLPYARLALGGPNGTAGRTATYGEPRHGRHTIELAHAGDPVGVLELGLRGPGETFTEAERRLVGEIGRQVAVAAHAARLADDLRASRERIVFSREEERRRLRRDLHDGIGPRLAALVMKLETARARFADQPAVVDLLTQLTGYARDTVADVRRVVRGLRPPSLDELGLVGALHELAARHSHDGMTVRLADDPAGMRLPAAVEAAVYRIVDEAVTNAVRHAGARTCVVRLTVQPEALAVQVRDDGRGLPADRTFGVGLTSMRERAEELGGTLSVESGSAGGTGVCARLPIDPAWSVAR